MADKKAAKRASKKPVKKPVKARSKSGPKQDLTAAAMPSKKQQRVAKKATVNAALVATTYDKLRQRHSDAHCELDHDGPFQLILATVLSAQSTDVMVNKITPELFQRWPTPEALARAEPSEVERVLSKIGMFRQKTKNVIGLSKRLLDEHHGRCPAPWTSSSSFRAWGGRPPTSYWESRSEPRRAWS